MHLKTQHVHVFKRVLLLLQEILDLNKNRRSSNWVMKPDNVTFAHLGITVHLSPVGGGECNNCKERENYNVMKYFG